MQRLSLKPRIKGLIPLVFWRDMALASFVVSSLVFCFLLAGLMLSYKPLPLEAESALIPRLQAHIAAQEAALSAQATETALSQAIIVRHSRLRPAYLHALWFSRKLDSAGYLAESFYSITTNYQIDNEKHTTRYLVSFDGSWTILSEQSCNHFKKWLHCKLLNFMPL
jgi:hypothetical protein